MIRSALAPAVALLICTFSASTALAQAKPAPPTKAAPPAKGATTATPAAPAKWVPPVKGIATIEVMRLPSKRVGKDILTTLQVKNTSSGSISLLKVEEYWYNRSTPRQMVSAATSYWKKPFLPGEIIEIALKSPAKPDADVSQIVFGHANGKIDAKTVKKF